MRRISFHNNNQYTRLVLTNNAPSLTSYRMTSPTGFRHTMPCLYPRAVRWAPAHPIFICRDCICFYCSDFIRSDSITMLQLILAKNFPGAPLPNPQSRSYARVPSPAKILICGPAISSGKTEVRNSKSRDKELTTCQGRPQISGEQGLVTIMCNDVLARGRAFTLSFLICFEELLRWRMSTECRYIVLNANQTA